MGKIITGKMDLSRRNQISKFMRDCAKELGDKNGHPILVLGAFEEDGKMHLTTMVPENIRKNKLALLYYLEQSLMAVTASLSPEEREALQAETSTDNG
jgi:hypothetical protein